MPITIVGEAKAVVSNDGIVDQAMFHLTISAKPGSIPDELTVDISALEIGHSIRVGDIALPPGVETHVDAEEPVVIGQSPQLEVPEVAEGEEGEGAAEGEGEAAEGEAAGEQAEAGDEG